MRNSYDAHGRAGRRTTSAARRRRIIDEEDEDDHLRDRNDDEGMERPPREVAYPRPRASSRYLDNNAGVPSSSLLGEHNPNFHRWDGSSASLSTMGAAAAMIGGGGGGGGFSSTPTPPTTTPRWKALVDKSGGTTAGSRATAPTEAATVESSSVDLSVSNARGVVVREDDERAQSCALVALSVAFVLYSVSLPALLLLSSVGVLSDRVVRARWRSFAARVANEHGGLLPYLLPALLSPSFSLHDWMTAEGTGLPPIMFDLALYYLPGLTNEQLRAYVERLPRERRELLLRPGALRERALESLVSYAPMGVPLLTTTDTRRERVLDVVATAPPLPNDLVWDDGDSNSNDASEDDEDDTASFHSAHEEERSDDYLLREAATNVAWTQFTDIARMTAETLTETMTEYFASSPSTTSMIRIGARTTGLLSLITAGHRAYGLGWFGALAVTTTRPSSLVALSSSSSRESGGATNEGTGAGDDAPSSSSFWLGRILASSTLFVGASTGAMWLMRRRVRQRMEARRRALEDGGE